MYLRPIAVNGSWISETFHDVESLPYLTRSQKQNLCKCYRMNSAIN